jgi:AraC family transcriptional regulator
MTNKLQPEIITLKEKKLIGKRIQMCFAVNKTNELWRSFMPRRKEIKNIAGIELYSVEVYPIEFFNSFNRETEFEKWAAIEVTGVETIPEGMEILTIPTGLYAVFIHKGPASEGPRTYQYVFETWLPTSDYRIDFRPHFAVMAEKYKHEDPGSEEEIWIPVRKKVKP